MMMFPSVFQLYSAVTNTHAKRRERKRKTEQQREARHDECDDERRENERERTMSDESGAHEKMFEIARSDESKTIKRK